MDFSFNNYGKLSVGNKTFKFSDVDTDGDGKISKAEYNEIKELLEEQGEDLVNFANVDRNKDQQIDENEFAIVEQKLKIQDHINQYKKIISVDFAGCSTDVMEALNDEIKDYINEYIDNYDGDVNDLANSFINDFPIKYAELREQLLTQKSDSTDSKKDETPQSTNKPLNIKGNDVINNTTDPGIAMLNKAYGENKNLHFELHNEYIFSVDNVGCFESDRCGDTKTALQKINGHRESFREQFIKQCGSSCTSEILEKFDEIYDITAKDLINSLLNGKTCNSWESVSSWDELTFHSIRNEELLTRFADALNNNLNTQFSNTVINADKIELKDGENVHEDLYRILETLNEYKEDFRNQLKAKLGANYTADVDKLFEEVYSKSTKDVMSKFEMDHWESSKCLEEYYRTGNEAELFYIRIYEVPTSEVLSKFGEVFNANMEKELAYQSNPGAVSSDKIEVNSERHHYNLLRVLDTLNEYKEDFRAQLKAKLGANYTADVDKLFEEVYSKSTKDVMSEFEMDHWFSSDHLEKYYRSGDEAELSRVHIETVSTSEVLSKFGEVFNANMEKELETLMIDVSAVNEPSSEEIDEAAVSNDKESELGSNKFDDILQEMRENVPDCTKNIEEKNLAINYINRLLTSDDITPELKEYWQNKKEIIEQEILAIENQEAEPAGDSFVDVLKKFNRFTLRYKRTDMSSKTDDSSVEYNKTYTRVAISFINRLLNCPDITAMQKAKYTSMLAELKKQSLNE